MTASPPAEEVRRKRKADRISKDQEELEVDLNAPEPPSKKSLRKARKTGPKDEPHKVTVFQADSSGTPNSDDDDEPRGKLKPRRMLEADAQANGQSAHVTSRETTSKTSPSEYGIWIGNLAFFSTKDDVMNFLTRPDTGITAQDITRVNLPKGSAKNGRPQNKGFAYVDFMDEKIQQAAIALSERLLGGRQVLIKSSKSFEGRPEKPSSDLKSNTPSSKRIFTGNLSFDITKEDLENHFSQCGAIEHIHVATFQDSGKCKGFAWVTFEELPAAEAAVRGWIEAPVDVGNEQTDSFSKNGKSRRSRIHVNKIMGRPLRMEFAEDPTTRYKKRFGKGSHEQENSISEPDENSPVTRPATFEINAEQNADGEARKTRAEVRSKPRHMDKAKGKVDNSRYGQSTVQRLTGAAVQGQGKKITFD